MKRYLPFNRISSPQQLHHLMSLAIPQLPLLKRDQQEVQEQERVGVYCTNEEVKQEVPYFYNFRN